MAVFMVVVVPCLVRVLRVVGGGSSLRFKRSERTSDSLTLHASAISQLFHPAHSPSLSNVSTALRALGWSRLACGGGFLSGHFGQ